MSLSSKKEQTAKPLRLDKRIAKDIEMLSKMSGRSQNDLIVGAIKKYLYDNRQFFIGDLIKDILLDKLDYTIVTMREEWDDRFGSLYLRIFKTEKSEIYKIIIEFHNKFDEVIFSNQRYVNILNEEWDDFKDYLLQNIFKYIDLDDGDMRTYFIDRFNYE